MTSPIDPRYPFCFILSGPAGVGKSSMRRTLLTHPVLKNACVISSDDIIAQMAVESSLSYNEIYDNLSNHKFSNILHDLINEAEKAVGSYRSIIIDRLNLTAENRASFLRRIPGSYNKIALTFPTDEDVLFDRNRLRMEQGEKHVKPKHLTEMLRDYEVPTCAEVDAVFHIDDPFTLPF